LQDDSGEVNACVAEKRERGGLCEEFDINVRDVAYNVMIMINNSQRRNTFIQEEGECF
jgi:hypothetical protein